MLQYSSPCGKLLLYWFVVYIYTVGLLNINSFVLFLAKSFYKLNCFLSNVDREFTILLSFHLTAVMFGERSLTTSNVPRISFVILPKSCNGAFSKRFVLTVPVAAISFELKCCSNLGLAKKLFMTCKEIVHYYMVVWITNIR